MIIISVRIEFLFKLLMELLMNVYKILKTISLDDSTKKATIFILNAIKREKAPNKVKEVGENGLISQPFDLSDFLN